MNSDTAFLIFIFAAILLVVIGCITSNVSFKKFIKKRKSVLVPGRKIIYYACINKEFNDWKKIAEYTIVACGDEYFQYTNGKQLFYETYWHFGKYDDKVEVYDGDVLVFVAGSPQQ